MAGVEEGRHDPASELSYYMGKFNIIKQSTCDRCMAMATFKSTHFRHPFRYFN